MFVFGIIIFVGAGILYTFSTLAMTTLRQRKPNAQTGEENGDENEQEKLNEKEQKIQDNKQINRRTILYIIAIVLILILIILLIIYLWVVKYGSPPSPYPPYECDPLTQEERIFYFKNYETIAPKFEFSSNEVKLLFLQGFALIGDFNRHEAINSFKISVDLDPKCAICYWGLGYAQGPFANFVGGESSPYFPVFNDQARIEALKAAKKAEEVMDQNNDKLKMYINALIQRYSGDSDWYTAENQFALNMQKIYQKYPDDLTSLVIASDANMTSDAWNYYDKNNQLTPKFQSTYENLKFVDSKQTNVLALHLLVHLTEQYLRFEGEKYADKLAHVAHLPHAHLIHMPTHLYIRIGRYHDAYVRNFQAYEIETQHAERCFATYIPEHNLMSGHVGASMAGEFQKAEELAILMKRLPYEMPMVYQAPGVNWVTYPLLMIRFAKWNKLAQFLDADIPDANSRGVSHLNGQEYAQIVQTFGFIMYLSAISEAWTRYSEQIPEMDIEKFELVADRGKSAREMTIAYLDTLRDQIFKLPYDVQTRPGEGAGVYSGSYKNLSSIYLEISEARISVLDQDFKNAEFHLLNAIKIEDNMGYIEPFRMYQPVRQCLGWVREMLGDFLGAKKIYEEDLKEYPKNGWSLLGLIRVGKKLGESTEDLEKKFQEAWKYSDFQLDSSCPAFSRLTDN